MPPTSMPPPEGALPESMLELALEHGDAAALGDDLGVRARHGRAQGAELGAGRSQLPLDACPELVERGGRARRVELGLIALGLRDGLARGGEALLGALELTASEGRLVAPRPLGELIHHNRKKHAQFQPIEQPKGCG